MSRSDPSPRHPPLRLGRDAGHLARVIPDISRATTDTVVQLSPGDVVVLYSDGVLEAANPTGQQLGMERHRTPSCAASAATRQLPPSPSAMLPSGSLGASPNTSPNTSRTLPQHFTDPRKLDERRAKLVAAAPRRHHAAGPCATKGRGQRGDRNERGIGAIPDKRRSGFCDLSHCRPHGCGAHHAGAARDRRYRAIDRLARWGCQPPGAGGSRALGKCRQVHAGSAAPGAVAAVDHHGPKARVTVCNVSNRAIYQRMRRRLSRLNRSQDIAALYQSPDRKSIVRKAGSGLRLARIRAEADMKLFCAFAGDMLSVRASDDRSMAMPIKELSFERETFAVRTTRRSAGRAHHRPVGLRRSASVLLGRVQHARLSGS